MPRGRLPYRPLGLMENLQVDGVTFDAYQRVR
jgi:hypothetical protein